jgi:hypothetical protein
MSANYPGVFADPAALTGPQLTWPPSPAPTSAQLTPLSGVCAAVGLGAGDVDAILAASGAANALTLDTLTALVRYSRLAKALAVSVPDLVLWITLAGVSPFGAGPHGTLEFLRRLALLQGPGLGPQDLDYLLRGQSAAQSTLAFTQPQADALVQSVRDAVAKAAVGPITITAVISASPIGITTSKPHGLATGTTVFVSGVGGEPGADGRFHITVIDATHFTPAARRPRWSPRPSPRRRCSR